MSPSSASYYPGESPFKIKDIALALFVLTIILLGGGTTFEVKALIYIVLGLVLYIQLPKTVPSVCVDRFVIGLVVLSLIQFLPASMFSVAEWRKVLEGDCAIALSPTISPQLYVSLEGYLTFLSALAWLYICLNSDIAHSSRIRSLWALALGGGLLSVLLICGHYYGLRYPFAKEATVFSFFPNRNQSSHVLCLSALVSFGLFVKAFNRKRNRFALISLINTILIFFALVFSLSRASLIFFFLGLLLWLGLQSIKTRRLIKLRYFLPILVILISLWLMSSGDNLNRFLHLINPDTEADFRLLIFKDAIKFIQEQLFTGLGIGNFQYVFPQYRDHSVLYGKILHPENDWLWACAELGILFTLVLALASFWGLFKSIKEQPYDRISYRSIAFIGLFVFFFHTFVDVPGHRLGTVFYAILLFSLSINDEKAVATLIPRYVFQSLAVLLIVYGLIGLFSSLFKLPILNGVAEKVYKQKVLNLAQLKKSDEALAVLKLGKARIPMSPWWYFQEGQLQLRLGNSFLKAKKEFEKARALDPYDIHLALQEGLVWLPYSLDLAFRAWQVALNLNNFADDNTWTFIWNHTDGSRCQKYLSLLSKSHADFRVFYLKRIASSVFEKEIQWDLSKDPKLQYVPEKDRLIIFVKWAQADPHALLAHLSQYPDVLQETWLMSATAYMRLRFYEAASKLFDKNVQAPQWPLLYHSQSSTVEELELRSSLNPKDTVLSLALLKIYIEQSKFTKALSTLRHLEALQYKAPLLDYWKGKLYRTQGKYEESCQAYEEFLKSK